jgi:hypothetical protein
MKRKSFEEPTAKGKAKKDEASDSSRWVVPMVMCRRGADEMGSGEGTRGVK